MADILHTTTTAVRAAIGLTPRDISDEDVLAAGLEDQLQVDLYQWLPDHQTIVLAGETLEPDPDDAVKAMLVRLYCQYQAAFLLVETSAQSRILQKISDGVNEGQRFKEHSLHEWSALLRSRALQYRRRLEGLLGLDVGREPLSPFGIARPNYDPVSDWLPNG